ncbi:MAG: YncE family protein [Endomicrobiales bacterium]
MNKLFLKTLCLLGSVMITSLVYADVPGYHVIKKIKIGGEGGWDYVSIDSGARRLYISRSTHVVVVDIQTDKVVGDIANTQGVHGIALASSLNRGYTSNGKENTATIFDLKTLAVIKKVPTGKNPDAILYDPASQTVFTFNGGSKDATVFDAISGVVVSTIALGGKPEFAATNSKGKVFVNIENTSEVVEIDSQKDVILNRFSLKPGEEPSGMGLDALHDRVFSGCHNNLMTVLDGMSGKMIATVPIGSGVDANIFDPVTDLAFSSNGDGTLTVVKESSGTYSVAEVVQTQLGARTMALDTLTHTIYLPTAEFAPVAKPTTDAPRPRPKPIKDTFVILVVGK